MIAGRPVTNVTPRSTWLMFAFINNHYAGHGPASCRQLRALLDETA
jgi:hypothetical protein